MECGTSRESDTDEDTQEYDMEPPLKKFKSITNNHDNESSIDHVDDESTTNSDISEAQVQSETELGCKPEQIPQSLIGEQGSGDTTETGERMRHRTKSLESGGFDPSEGTYFECDNCEDSRDSFNSGGFDTTEISSELQNGATSENEDIDKSFKSTTGTSLGIGNSCSGVLGPVRSEVAGTSSKSSLHKVSSIARDAENISAMFGLDSVDNAVYQRLKQLRTKGNRTDIVTNEILEHGLESLKENVNEKDEGDSGIFDEMDTVKSCLIERLPKVRVDADEIYTLLEASGDGVQRVSSVVDQLVKRYCESSNVTTAKLSGENDIFSRVQQVLKKLPGTDPNVIYDLLEANSDKENCVETVINNLQHKAQSTSGGEAIKPTRALSLPGGAHSVHDHLYNDMNMVASMFPNKDKNEIFAYLEAHYLQPNRVQMVTEELLRMEQEKHVNGGPGVTGHGANDTVSGMTKSDHSIVQLQRDVEMLKKIFPDCDPNYLFENLESMSNEPDRVNRLSSSMFDKRNYPKLKDRLETEKRHEHVHRLRNMQLNIEEYLQMFPDPEEVFYDIGKPVSGNYREHTVIQLQNDFPMLSVKYIDKKLTEHRGHLLPAYVDLDRVAQKYRQDRVTAVREHKRFMYTPRPGTKRMPEVPDELFYKELLFVKNEEAIKDFIKDREDAKTRRQEEAREKGELHECTCCYDDEVMFEDMLSCPEGHLFCRECVRRQAEENIGQAKVKFPCLDGDCDKDFSMPSLQTVLSSKSFSILLRRIQEEEIRQADIDDLVSCPFCSFATIMSNPDDKIFRCLNPDCLKESCRLCQEPNHIPLRCDEVEKETEKNMRAFIEAKMTEAMIRVCWKCNKRFFKIEGCNKMTCTCGAHMCYVCREPIDGYDHFNNNGQCSNIQNAEELHQKEMEKAAAEARAQYEKDHPEAAGTSLKHDPVKLIMDRHSNGYAYNDSDDLVEESDDYSEPSSSDYEDQEYMY